MSAGPLDLGVVHKIGKCLKVGCRTTYWVRNYSAHHELYVISVPSKGGTHGCWQDPKVFEIFSDTTELIVGQLEQQKCSSPELKGKKFMQLMMPQQHKLDTQTKALLLYVAHTIVSLKDFSHILLTNTLWKV